jgi:integrase/recombinase XerD
MRDAGNGIHGSRIRGLIVVLALMPVGPLFCVINGLLAGDRWSGSAAREQLRQLAAAAGVRRPFAPHQLRHAHAVEMAREGVPRNVIQRQLGHADLCVTSVYLQGIDNTEVISTIHARRAPTMPASAGLLM